MDEMKCYEQMQPSTGELAAALGSFDGLHLGHRQVIGHTFSSHGLLPAVVTFRENPSVFLRPEPVPMLTTNRQKLELLKETGVDTVYLLPFEQVQDLEPEEFIRMLYQVCGVRKICCGFNFRFGKKGRGDTELLYRLCRELEQGGVQQAGQLLGRPFGYDFEVTHGRQLGRTWGTPTINQPFPKGYVLPKFGVYASLVHIDGKRYYGVTNIGVKPTVGSDCALSETWIPEFSGDLYGKQVPVDLLDFIRPERKFENLDELKNEILENGELARKIVEKRLQDSHSEK